MIHLCEPLAHARHYIGYADDIEARIKRHAAGSGARLMEVVKQRGIKWEVARVWPGADRAFERKLKSHHGAAPSCPICKAIKKGEENGRLDGCPTEVGYAGHEEEWTGLVWADGETVSSDT